MRKMSRPQFKRTVRLQESNDARRDPPCFNQPVRSVAERRYLRQDQTTADVDLGQWLAQTSPACTIRTDSARSLTNLQRSVGGSGMLQFTASIDFQGFEKLGAARLRVGKKMEND